MSIGPLSSRLRTLFLIDHPACTQGWTRCGSDWEMSEATALQVARWMVTIGLVTPRQFREWKELLDVALASPRNDGAGRWRSGSARR